MSHTVPYRTIIGSTLCGHDQLKAQRRNFITSMRTFQDSWFTTTISEILSTTISESLSRLLCLCAQRNTPLPNYCAFSKTYESVVGIYIIFVPLANPALAKDYLIESLMVLRLSLVEIPLALRHSSQQANVHMDWLEDSLCFVHADATRKSCWDPWAFA